VRGEEREAREGNRVVKLEEKGMAYSLDDPKTEGFCIDVALFDWDP
jgi:hypothetical protein